MIRLRSITAMLGPAVVAACADSGPFDPGFEKRQVTIDLCSPAIDRIAVLNQGEGWRSVQGSSGRFNVEVTEKVVIALMEGFVHGSDVSVLHLTADEVETLPCFDDSFVPGLKSATGSVTGLEETAFAGIAFSNASASAFPTSPEFLLMGIQPGKHDLVASLNVWDGGAMSTPKLIIRRDVEYPDGGVIPNLDFGSSESISTIKRTVAFNGIPAQSYRSVDLMIRAGGSTAFLLSSQSEYFGSATSIDAPPPAAIEMDDTFLVLGYTSSETDYRSVILPDDGAGDIALNFGPALATPTISRVATSPYHRYRVDLPVQGEYDRVVFAQIGQSTPSGQWRSWVMIATRGYMGDVQSWRLEMPDLSGVAGFSTTYGLGDYSFWSVQAANQSFSLQAITETEHRSAGRNLANYAMRSGGGVACRFRSDLVCRLSSASR